MELNNQKYVGLTYLYIHLPRSLLTKVHLNAIEPPAINFDGHAFLQFMIYHNRKLEIVTSLMTNSDTANCFIMDMITNPSWE